ncbi:BA75_05241T0 [Komagataella pastoris]|uniref:BA75_05241T0 n=1 Tax=Komagataella pastoris TaxID=4922 RepID=A0A1B2JIR3_PICPA|nr:BA75_05241T0 [Komagataella pastoris]
MFRDLADQAHKRRTQLSKESQEAYKSGDGERAHQLSQKAKEYLAQADYYNRQAAEYVFVENNADNEAHEIDLHGLYVREAEYIVKHRISAAVRREEKRLSIIVGKGNHSTNGVAKLKPAVENLCDEAGLHHEVSKKNTGVIEVDLSKPSRIPASWGQQPSEPQYVQPIPAGVYHQQQQQAGSSGSSIDWKLVVRVVKSIIRCFK